MKFKKLFTSILVILTLCTVLFTGCRKDDGKIPQENKNTNTPMESVESMIPDSAKNIIP